jgi:predicted TIM-barrel fold metal-dependent hydrolase
MADVANLDCKIFDSDSHLYEQRDAFTRHLPAAYKERCIHFVKEEGGKESVWAGSTRITISDSPHPQGGMVPRPGSLKEFLRKLHSAEGADGADVWVPMAEEFQFRQARLRLLEEQGVEGALVFGGTVVSSEPFFDDVDALYVQQHAYNEWLDEEWGFDYEGRLFAPAVITMRDLDRTITEVDWLIERGVRLVMPLPGPQGGRSPGDTYFDPIWSRLNEANVVLAYHTSEAIYAHEINRMWGERVLPPRWLQSAWQWMNTYGERPLMDTLSSIMFWNLFGRFPNLKVIAVEFGADWLPHFLSKMDKSRGMGRNGPWPGGPLPARPSHVFAEHGFVVPFPEDDVEEIATQIGPTATDILVMGSDFPHAEGVADPAQLLRNLTSFSVNDAQKMMHDNARRLLPVS